MSFRPVVLAAAGALVAAALTTATAQASQPTKSAEALAADAATSLVASRPAALHASADDAFVQRQVISSAGLKYVTYDRTYKGLPVYGGDFVVVTDSAGQVLNTSVAQESTLNLPSVTPVVSKGKAESVARGQLTKVDSVSDATLIAYAFGTPRLAWESTVSGRDADGPSKLSVIVDAVTGAVLDKQERVLNGDGTSGWNGPNPIHLDTTQSGSTFSLRDPAHHRELPGRRQQHSLQRTGRPVGQRKPDQPGDRLRRRVLRLADREQDAVAMAGTQQLRR